MICARPIASFDTCGSNHSADWMMRLCEVHQPKFGVRAEVLWQCALNWAADRKFLVTSTVEEQIYVAVNP